MAKFDYLALDASGAERSGEITAPDVVAARNLLTRRRLTPVRVAPRPVAAASEPAPRGRPPRPPRGKGLPSRTLALTIRQLATLIQVAPMEEALRTLAAQADDAAAREALSSLHAQVLEGQRLSDAMARQGARFSPMVRALVAAGEASGALPNVLERLADLLEKQEDIRAKVTSALVYPILLAATATFVVGALMAFIVPRVAAQFDSIGQDLPLLTQAVIAVSNAVQAFGAPVALAGLIGVFALLQARKSLNLRTRMDGAALRLPVVGRLARALNAARLARTLSTLLAAGMPMLEALAAAGRTVPNAAVARAVGKIGEQIREGGSLSGGLRRAGLFPPILVYLAANGEDSGRLDLMLTRAAEYLEREVNTATAVALSLLEPLVLVVMGVVVGLIVMAILLPILQFNALVFS